MLLPTEIRVYHVPVKKKAIRRRTPRHQKSSPLDTSAIVKLIREGVERFVLKDAPIGEFRRAIKKCGKERGGFLAPAHRHYLPSDREGGYQGAEKKGGEGPSYVIENEREQEKCEECGSGLLILSVKDPPGHSGRG